MFVDTSAVVAILLGEDDQPGFSSTIENAERRLISPAVRLETCIVVSTRRDVTPIRAQDYFEDLAAEIRFTEVKIDDRIGRLAVECFARYGKGRHPAQLNFGDCLSYACAKAYDARLLFKGDDFAKTDINAGR